MMAECFFNKVTHHFLILLQSFPAMITFYEATVSNLIAPDHLQYLHLNQTIAQWC